MLKGIIFDYGNTLVKSANLADSLVAVFKHEKAFEIGKEIDTSISNLYTPDQIEQPDWLKIWKSAFDKYDVPFDEEIGAGHLRTFVNQNKIYSYTKPLLSELKRKNLKLALLGNVTGPAEVFHQNLEHSGLGQYFDYVIWSCEIGFRKPSREAFQYVLDRLELKTNEVLMVGDSEIADIGGALKMGIKAIRVYDGTKPLISEADILSSRDELITIIMGMISSSKKKQGAFF